MIRYEKKLNSLLKNILPILMFLYKLISICRDSWYVDIEDIEDIDSSPT